MLAEVEEIQETKPVKKARKSPAVTKEMINGRISSILHALVNQNDFEFNMLMLQLSNWTVAKRKQIFRAILQNLISKTGSFEWEYLNPFLKQYGANYYSVHSNNLRSKALDKFVAKVKEMDKNERFSPEKVYTVSHLNLKIVALTPDSLRYLLENNILVLGETFRIRAANDTGIKGNLRTFHYATRNTKTITDVYKAAGLNMDIMTCPKRFHLVQVANITQNLQTIANTLIKDRKNLTQHEISVIVQINSLMGQVIKDLDEPVERMMYGGQKSWNLIIEELNKIPDRTAISEEEYQAVKAKMRLDLMKIIREGNELVHAQNLPEPVNVDTSMMFDPYNAVV